MDLEEEKGLSLLEQLGSRIAFLRKEKGLSQLKLSLDSNLSQTYINDIEAGRRNPTLLTLSKIANALQVSLSELLLGIEPIIEDFIK